MRFANKDGVRIIPNPMEKDATCPLCNEEVIAKCGKIKVWHWAHKSLEDCDTWSDGETAWHLDWKAEFDKDCQEIIIQKHRADVKVKDVVIEFQNSSISSDDIFEREEFYGKMKWVINGKKFANNFVFRNKGNFFTFRWKWPARSWEVSNRPIYIDMGITELGDGELYHKMFLIRKINWGSYVGGWGKIISKQSFLEDCKDGYY